MSCSNPPTQIVHDWLEAHDCTRQFWHQRAQRWAEQMPPDDARRRLAEDLELAVRRSLTDDTAAGLWIKMAAWALDEVNWIELAGRRLAGTSRATIWNRLSHGAACGDVRTEGLAGTA